METSGFPSTQIRRANPRGLLYKCCTDCVSNYTYFLEVKRDSISDLRCDWLISSIKEFSLEISVVLPAVVWFNSASLAGTVWLQLAINKCWLSWWHTCYLLSFWTVSDPVLRHKPLLSLALQCTCSLLGAFLGARSWMPEAYRLSPILLVLSHAWVMILLMCHTYLQIHAPGSMKFSRIWLCSHCYIDCVPWWLNKDGRNR